MKLSNRTISLLCILAWLSFVIFLFLDTQGTFGSDIGIMETLRTSSLARGMFYDIGLLSTIFAAWIAFGNTLKFRYIFAVATLFVGSGALLPFLAYYYYKKP